MLFGRHELAPRYDANDGEVYSDVDHCDGDDADDHRARNRSSRLLHFVADVTDVVITQVVEDADPRRGTQTEEEAEREIERARRKVKSDSGVEMKDAGEDHRERRKDSS